MAFAEIAFFNVLGIPLLRLLGIATILLVIATATTGYFILKGKAKLSQHKMLAIIAILVAIVHGLLALLSTL
jgi:hypothetical protein